VIDRIPILRNGHLEAMAPVIIVVAAEKPVIAGLKETGRKLRN
jgi:hypothetical protein